MTVSISPGLLCLQGKLLGPWHLLPGFSTIKVQGGLPTFAPRRHRDENDETDLQRSCRQGAMAKSEVHEGTMIFVP